MNDESRFSSFSIHRSSFFPMSLRRDPYFKLLLVRHGQTDSNREMRFVGRGDYPLNETGRKQVRATAKRINGRAIDQIYSSPASRAFETAQILNQGFSAPLQKHESLWETNFGNWEGLTFKEIVDRDPQLFQDWMNLKIDAPHGGETLDDVAQRAKTWITDLHANHPNHTEKTYTVLVTSHGGFLQTLMCELLGTTNRNFWSYRFDNAGLAEVWVYPLGATLISFG